MFAGDDSATMLTEMSACAHRLGMAFGREAERAEAWDRKVEFFNLFDRCFFGVRVSIALKMRLRREAVAGVAARREDAGEAEDLRERPEPPETERPARERLDADREREGERASLPILLKTLRSVAADTAALPGPPPAALPALTELLARSTGDPGPAARPASRDLRTRLAGASTAAMTTAPPRTGVAVSGRRLRPATGPPRR